MIIMIVVVVLLVVVYMVMEDSGKVKNVKMSDKFQKFYSVSIYRRYRHLLELYYSLLTADWRVQAVVY